MKNVINYSFFMIFTALVTLSGCKKNNPVPAPVINTVSPSSGLAGVSVTISGSNFNTTASGNTVKFNGFAATVTSATAGALVVTAPVGGSTGAITVTTIGGTATGPAFTYLQAPTITSISPVSAKAGSAVTITGTNFDVVASNDIVKFNGTTATVTTATSTSLIVTAPAGGSSGAITVTTLGGTANGPAFTYLQAPTITGISPASAAAGASVTITGTNFDATVANDAVSFNGAVATVTNATVSQLVVTVPAGGTSGNVTVTTSGGTSNTFAFTYITSTGPNIFVLGSDTRFGFGYWKNSTFTATPDCISPYAMTGSGTDFYVAGSSSGHTPTYWKNNTAVQVSSQTGYTVSIVVSGTDIYCLGIANNAYYVWKNGAAQPLTMIVTDIIAGSVNGMAVNNGDVYVAGARYLGNSTILKATYWKNGTPVDLTDGITSGSARATAVYVSGSNVYVAGTEEIVSGGGIVNRAPRLWKNGVSIPLNTPANSIFNNVSSLLVSGSNVYVGGQYNGAGAVWKNGTMVSPATYSVAENVSSIFLYNNTDLYITGASSSSGNNCYWKNGNFVEMDPGCNVVSTNCANTFANQVLSIYVK
ncbi:MAG: beta strand repeat-containing protein [Mucilaginibacter sp.]